MTVQEFDLIQRIRVENGVPRMVSTTFKIIEGGEDLLSLAISLLKQMGIYDKFEENRTSQYIGYRLKNPQKGAKRYQLVLFPKKGELSISLLQELFSDNHLEFYETYLSGFEDGIEQYKDHSLAKLFVFPSKEDIFIQSINKKYSPNVLNGEIFGKKLLGFWNDEPHSYVDKDEHEFRGEFNNYQITEELISGKDYLVLNQDTLFPYTWQVSISSSEVLSEFLSYFVPILMRP